MHSNLSQLHVNVSAYCLALAVTLALCLLVLGILYVDLCANQTILSAHGVIYPMVERVIDMADRILR